MTLATRTTAARAGAFLAFALAATFIGACGGATGVALPAPTGAAPSDAAPSDAAPTDATTGDAAAPGNGADQPAGAGVCALIDPSLAGSALGGATVDAGTAKHTSVFDGDGCVFRDTASGDWVLIWVYADLTRDDWQATAEKTGAAAGDVIDGLGEAAYRSVGASTGLRVDVFDDGLGVSIAVRQQGIDAARATPPTLEIVRSLLAQLS